MSLFWNGVRIGRPAAPLGQISVRKDGRKFKKVQGGWVQIGQEKPKTGGKTKIIKRRIRSRYR